MSGCSWVSTLRIAAKLRWAWVTAARDAEASGGEGGGEEGPRGAAGIYAFLSFDWSPLQVYTLSSHLIGPPRGAAGAAEAVVRGGARQVGGQGGAVGHLQGDEDSGVYLHPNSQTHSNTLKHTQTYTLKHIQTNSNTPKHTQTNTRHRPTLTPHSLSTIFAPRSSEVARHLCAHEDSSALCLRSFSCRLTVTRRWGISPDA
eukprot:1176487-Prorocentrum_minimum.AAC.3